MVSIMSPRNAWLAIRDSLPDDVITSSDISNTYPAFEKGHKYTEPADQVSVPIASDALLDLYQTVTATGFDTM